MANALSTAADRPLPPDAGPDSPALPRTASGAVAGSHDHQVTLAALRDTEALYRALFESIDEGFVLAEVLFDADGRARNVFFREANAAAKRLTGLDFDARLLTEVFPVVGTHWLEAWERIVSTGGGERTEAYTASLDAWYSQYMFRIGEREDGRVGCIFQDITQRRRAEAAMVEAREAAERASQAKSQFMSTISHELRTPLTAVLGFADLLEGEVAGPVNQRQQAYLARIKASTRHLVRIIDEILTFTRTEADRDEVRLELVDLAAIATDVVAMLASDADKRDLLLLVRGADQPLPLRTDEGKVRQILLNLAGNALKYTEAGSIEVELETTPEHVLLHVRDTGVGIPADRLEDIFQPFVQVDGSTTRRYGGTGLGLAISRRHAQELDGDVTVTSTPGRGSTFTVCLPLR